MRIAIYSITSFKDLQTKSAIYGPITPGLPELRSAYSAISQAKPQYCLGRRNVALLESRALVWHGSVRECSYLAIYSSPFYLAQPEIDH